MAGRTPCCMPSCAPDCWLSTTHYRWAALTQCDRMRKVSARCMCQQCLTQAFATLLPSQSGQLALSRPRLLPPICILISYLFSLVALPLQLSRCTTSPKRCALTRPASRTPRRPGGTPPTRGTPVQVGPAHSLSAHAQSLLCELLMSNAYCDTPNLLGALVVFNPLDTVATSLLQTAPLARPAARRQRGRTME